MTCFQYCLYCHFSALLDNYECRACSSVFCMAVVLLLISMQFVCFSGNESSRNAVVLINLFIYYLKKIFWLVTKFLKILCSSHQQIQTNACLKKLRRCKSRANIFRLKSRDTGLKKLFLRIGNVSLTCYHRVRGKCAFVYAVWNWIVMNLLKFGLFSADTITFSIIVFSKCKMFHTELASRFNL